MSRKTKIPITRTASADTPIVLVSPRQNGEVTTEECGMVSSGETARRNGTVSAVYQVLVKASEKMKDLTEDEQRSLWPRLTRLESREADTVYHLMKHHRTFYPKQGRSVTTDYPYESLEVRDYDWEGEKVNGLLVYGDTLPMKLVKILCTYIDTLEKRDEDDV